MVCSIIDECRCFAYSDVSNPKTQQFCGVRRGPNVIPCPEEECCAGGCVGEPFRIIERPTIAADYSKLYLILLLVIGLIFIIIS